MGQPVFESLSGYLQIQHLLHHISLYHPRGTHIFTTVLSLPDPFAESRELFLVCVCACVLSCVQLFQTSWTAAYHAPLSMEFSRQEYWSVLPFPIPGDLSGLGIEPASPVSSIGQQILYHCTTWEATQFLRIVSYLSISHCHLHFSHPDPSHHYLLPKNTKVNIFTGFPSSVSAFYNLFSIHNKLLQT